MKLTVFAATGRIGSLIVQQAISAGHDVTAVVRNPGALANKTIRAVGVDLSAPDPGAIKEAVRGADVILSGLGPRTRADSGITAPGTRAIVNAAGAEGVDRIIVVSAAPVGTVARAGHPNPVKHDPGDGPLMRYVLTPFIKAVLRAHYIDLAEMEGLLRESGMNWTAVRPPRLVDKPFNVNYRIAYGQNVKGGLTASRADVAHYMLRAIDDPRSFHQTVGIAS